MAGLHHLGRTAAAAANAGCRHWQTQTPIMIIIMIRS